MSSAKRPEQKEPASEHTRRAIVAMRLATVEATIGPRWMRAGRFNPQPDPKPDVYDERAIEAMRQAKEDVLRGDPDAIAGRYYPLPKKADE